MSHTTSLAVEFEPAETMIRNWIVQNSRDRWGVRTDGLTTEERTELNQKRDPT